ncbi:MAG TPA: hypothetical protein VJG32_21810 [Anaerolineae bacterium]|nr:hypothetical protein [Anaerolineae bacterium]
MHMHGGSGRKKDSPVWFGLLLAGVILAVVIFSIVRTGWIALAPFGFAGVILAILMWLMRATDRAAK